MSQPQLTSIGALNSLIELNLQTLFEVESTTEGSKKLSAGELASFIVSQAGATYYTKAETDQRYLAADDERVANAVQTTALGQPNGIPTLDESGHVPASQLPSYVDDVMEFGDFDAFPEVGESGKIYVDLETDLTYRWTGTVYRRIADGDVSTVNGRKGNVVGLAEQEDLDALADNVYTKVEADERYRSINHQTQWLEVANKPPFIAAGTNEAHVRTLLSVDSSAEVDAKVNALATTVGEQHYTKVEAEQRYFKLGDKLSFDHVEDVSDFLSDLAAATTIEEARAAVGASDSLSIGTTAGTAAEGNDSRIVNAIQSSEKGQPNGIATLDESGHVPASQLPSYVDDVMEFADLGSFPTTGESGKIYVDLATDLTYRWTGTVYRRIADGDVASVNGRKGNVEGLAEQEDLEALADSVYTKVEADERYVEAATSTAGNFLYARIGNANGAIPVSNTASGDSVVQRGSDGTIATAPATANGHAVNKEQFDSALQAVNQGIANIGNTMTNYSLPAAVLANNQQVSYNDGQVYLVNSYRTIEINSMATDRTYVIAILIEGDSPVTWDGIIDWVDETPPILGLNYTVVNILHIEGRFIGNLLVANDDASMPV